MLGTSRGAQVVVEVKLTRHERGMGITFDVGRASSQGRHSKCQLQATSRRMSEIEKRSTEIDVEPDTGLRTLLQRSQPTLSLLQFCHSQSAQTMRTRGMRARWTLALIAICTVVEDDLRR